MPQALALMPLFALNEEHYQYHLLMQSLITPLSISSHATQLHFTSTLNPQLPSITSPANASCLSCSALFWEMCTPRAAVVNISRFA